MVRLLTDVMTIPPGGGCYRGPRLGTDRVCRPVAHRSNSRSVEMIPNGICRVRLMRIAVRLGGGGCYG